MAEELYAILTEDEFTEDSKKAALITIEIGRTGHPFSITAEEYQTFLNTYQPGISTVNPALYMVYFSVNYAIIKAEHPDWSWLRIAYHASREVIHIALDTVGLVPVIGEIADLSNATLYYLEGDGLNATLSLGSAIPIAGWYVTGIKYAKKAITTVSGSTHTLNWIIKTNNLIDFGRGSSLRRVLGLAAGDPRQAHHIIPWQRINHDVVQKAAHGNNAFHMNEILNGLPLSQAQHLSDHAGYNAKVLEELNKIQARLGSNLNPTNAKNEIELLINRIKTQLINNPNSPLGDIIF